MKVVGEGWRADGGRGGVRVGAEAVDKGHDVVTER